MAKDRFPALPPPSLPREAPWREIEEIIDGLKTVALKLDILTAIYSGAPVPPTIVAPVTPTIPVPPPTIPVPPELTPITSRLDEIVKYIRNRPAWDHGQKDVATADTAEQLPDMPIPDGFYGVVRAKPGNEDDIYLGKSKGNASRPDTRITLAAGEAHKLRVKSFSLWFVDAAVSGDGVEYFVEKD